MDAPCQKQKLNEGGPTLQNFTLRTAPVTMATNQAVVLHGVNDMRLEPWPVPTVGPKDVRLFGGAASQKVWALL